MWLDHYTPNEFTMNVTYASWCQCSHSCPWCWRAECSGPGRVVAARVSTPPCIPSPSWGTSTRTTHTDTHTTQTLNKLIKLKKICGFAQPVPSLTGRLQALRTECVTQETQQTVNHTGCSRTAISWSQQQVIMYNWLTATAGARFHNLKHTSTLLWPHSQVQPALFIY
jgi:hypothetical protein